ncbi:MAG: orotidine-5'-phosphate decarboxylase [Kiritimatiellae bacterium]|nr:orotidine-5'-phosphate decarboxylase [Kiritimatiellia bacterium]MDW8459453.1 orotidine-5'-phosphate decarboxylase [Verrucomicrobiota bacterium]
MSSEPALVVALDVPSTADLHQVLSQMPSDVEWFKVGLELFTAEGPSALEPLKTRRARIFLDLKLHDIPRTVARSVRSAARYGVQMLTIHASGGRAMVRAAAEAAQEFGTARPRIVAVTALTSLSDVDLVDLGIKRSMQQQVLALGRLALESGADGLVCSPLEVEWLRREFGPEPLLVTPGIRAAGETRGDQQRTLSAAEATRAGSTHVVVGRPILEASDPHAAALRILEEIRGARRLLDD